MTNTKILRSTLVVTAAMFLTRFLGLIRESVLASAYGAGTISDAFITAFTLPNTILACLGTSLATVYVPLFQENREDADRFTSNIINIVSILGLFLTVLFIMFPKVLVSVFASGFDSETYELTVTFTRIMMLSTLPILLFNVLKAYEQIFGAFFLATVFDAFINLLVIAGIMVSKLTYTLKIMAYAAVVGNFICFICLMHSCVKHGFHYKPYINIKEQRIKKLFYLILPVFIGTAIAELNTIIDRNFASSLMSGTVSAMNFANKINGILYSFLSTSITTVLYPELVRLATDKKEEEVKNYISRCIMILTYVILPISVMIIILAKPIVEILFQRGSFTYENTVLTAQCVQMYAIGYVTVNINPILNRVFYAFNDTKTPTINSALAVSLNVFLNFVLVEKFKHMGLAFSTSVASIFTTALLLIQLSKKLNGLKIKIIASDVIKIFISTALASIIIYMLQRLAIKYTTNNLGKLISLIVIIVVGGAIYVANTVIMKITIIGEVKKIIEKKRRKNC